MYVQRTIEKAIINVSKSFHCIAIYGPRQVGKSTTVHQLFKDSFGYVSLDNLDDRALAISNPRAFLDSYRWPLVINEIQKAPLLLDEIKRRIDEQRLKWLDSNEDRSLMYVITGSNRFELQQGISDSLAGRCSIIDMYGFSNPEINQVEARLFNPNIEILLDRERDSKLTYKTREQIFESIFKGGMPDVVTQIADREFYFKSYVSTYLEKDVKKLIQASSENLFLNFLQILALRTSQELHYDVLARDCGVDTRTLKKWISILETSGIVYLLRPYMANVSNRIIKAPKLYFLDTGLCAYLSKIPNAQMLEKYTLSGAFFETYVVSEIVKNLSSFNLDPKDYLFYYRDSDQKEIDLLFVKDRSIYPIEVKKGITPKKATKNFKVLDKYNLPIKNGLVIDCTDKIRAIGDGNYYYPVHLLGS